MTPGKNSSDIYNPDELFQYVNIEAHQGKTLSRMRFCTKEDFDKVNLSKYWMEKQQLCLDKQNIDKDKIDVTVKDCDSSTK